jgi:creatinine amidohydrolase
MDRFAEYTATSVGDRLANVEVALLPTGAVEGHGPALPLGTDSHIARAIAAGVDRDDAVLLPTLPVGVAPEGERPVGTLATDPATFAASVEDIVDSLASHGCRKVVIVNGSDANEDALDRTARECRNRDRAVVVPWTWWSDIYGILAEVFGVSGLSHADAAETSLFMAVSGEEIDDERLEAAAAGFGPDAFTGHDAVSDPRDASLTAGKRLYERVTADLDALVGWLAEQEFDDIPPSDR